MTLPRLGSVKHKCSRVDLLKPTNRLRRLFLVDQSAKMQRCVLRKHGYSARVELFACFQESILIFSPPKDTFCHVEGELLSWTGTWDHSSVMINGMDRRKVVESSSGRIVWLNILFGSFVGSRISRSVLARRWDFHRQLVLFVNYYLVGKRTRQ